MKNCYRLPAMFSLIVVLGCSREDAETNSYGLDKMDHYNLLMLITKTDNNAKRLSAAGVIINRLAQQNKSTTLTATDFDLLSFQSQRLLADKNPRIRETGIFLLYKLATLFTKIKNPEIRQQITSEMCKIRTIMLQLKNDPDEQVRYRVVFGMSSFPENREKTYADFKTMELDSSITVRQTVNRIKIAAQNTETATDKKLTVDCN